MGNEIRIGKVSAVNYKDGTAQVVYHAEDNNVTAMLPLLSAEYKMPQVGEQVLVLHLSSGSESGVIIGRPWSEKNKPPEGKEGLYRKDLGGSPGEAMIKYGNGTLTIQAGAVAVNGNLSVNGNVTVSGTITAAGITAAGDITAGGKSLMHHTHQDSQGGDTTPPK